MALCPYCETPVGHVNIQDVTVGGFMAQNQWHGITYACPHCQKVLSVAIDPIAIKTDIVEEILAGLRRR